VGAGERGWPFVAWMIVVLFAVCGLAALFGVPAADGLFFGLAGTLLGIGAARILLPHKAWGLLGGTVLMIVAVVTLQVGFQLSVLDFSTLRGVFFWGLCVGFWPAAASRLTDARRTRV
jgi:hypothetical protein